MGSIYFILKPVVSEHKKQCMYNTSFRTTTPWLSAVDQGWATDRLDGVWAVAAASHVDKRTIADLIVFGVSLTEALRWGVLTCTWAVSAGQMRE